jgi:hypothetical protein
VAAIITGAWTTAVSSAAVTHDAMPLSASSPFAVLLVILMSAFTLWLAFADERWRLSPGVLEHRVGFPAWAYVRRIEDRSAALTIAAGFAKNFGTPYYRLYALASGTRHFLIERGHGELKAVAAVIESHTGWPVDDPYLDS